MIRAKSLAWIGGVGLLGWTPAAVLAQGLPLPPDNTVPVNVAPSTTDVVQTGGEQSLKPRDILKTGVENHRKLEFELAEVYLKRATELKASLTAAEQKELDATVQSNAKALAMRKTGQEMIKKAGDAYNAGRYQEANTLVQSLKANTYLAARDRESVSTLGDLLSKSGATGTAVASTGPAVPPRGRTPADMLAAGREAFKNKSYDEAISYAIACKQAGGAGRMPWDDTPDKLIADCNTAKAAMAKAPTTPGGNERAVAQCKQLCMQASQALAAGDVATAKRLTKQAEDLKVNLPWFEENSPAKLNEAIARVEKGGVRGSTVVAGNTADPRQAVKEARVALSQGNLDRCEELCNTARVAKVNWGYFEDTPDKLLAEVKSQRKVVNDKKAADLLVQARQLMNAGQLDEAERCCAQSKMLKNDYGIMDRFGERPDKLMEEIKAKQVVANRNKPVTPPTDNKVAVNPVTPAGNNTLPVPPVMSAPSLGGAPTVTTDARTAEANRLMTIARMELNKGNYEAALQNAAKVKQMGVVTQDSPDSIYKAVEVVMATRDRKANPVAADTKRMRALQLLANARVMAKNGDIMGAHKCVTEAQSLGVVFQQGDELPEVVMADLQSKAKVQVETYTKAADTLAARGKTGEAQQYRNYVVNVAMKFNVPAPQGGVPGTLNAPAATDIASTGKRLCTDIESCMREGQLAQARKLANTLYEGPYGMKAQAGQYLVQLDAAEMKTAVKTSEQYFDLVVKAVSRKEYDLAKQYAEKIDRKLLDETKVKQLNDMLNVPVMPTEKSVIQTAGGTSPQDTKPQSSPLLDELRKKHEVESQRLNEVKNVAIARAIKHAQANNLDSAIAELKSALETVKKADVDVPNVTTMVRQLDLKIRNYERLNEQVAYEREAKEKFEAKGNAKARKAADAENRKTQVAALMAEYKTLMSQGKFAEAEARAERAFAIDPDNPAIDASRQAAHMQDALAKESAGVRNNRNQWVESMGDINSKSVVGDSTPLKYSEDFTSKGFTRAQKALERMNRDRKDDLLNSSKFNTTVSVDFRNKPLHSVVDELRILSGGINMILEAQALADAGIDASMPITLTLNNVPVRSVLNALLTQTQLSYYVRDGIVNITTKEARASHKVRRSFAVHDLIVPRDDMATLPNYNEKGTPISTTGGEFNAFSGAGNGRDSYQGNTNPSNGLGNVQVQRRTGQTLEKQLMHLITSTIEPESWKDNGTGTGSIQYYPMGMTLVVSQSSDIQEQIEELIKRLRELQEVQVTVEVRILTLTDDFFERMGVNFNVSIPDKQTNFDRQVASGSFAPDGSLNYPDHTKGVIVGLTPAGNFTNNLNIPISNDSYNAARLPTGFAGMGAPGNTGGLDVGVAFLSSIQVFLVMEAVQGDVRNNTLQAPKITMFNGQAASISSFTNELFVTAVQPTINLFTGIPVFTPIQTSFPSGTTLTVQAVVTNDRRYVQLTLQPVISTVTDRSRAFTAVAGITVQQPVTSTITLATTVMVPDGGTILVGGLKSMSEQRREFGPPILSKIPYVSRLFRNQSYGKTATSLMFMVTPRIIINEEEEEKLGSTWTF